MFESSLTSPSTSASRSLVMSEQAFRERFDASSPGATIVYHRGYLAMDRVRGHGRLNAKNSGELDRLATFVLSMSEAGAGHLLQQRHGVADYSYLFVVAVPRTATILYFRSPMRRTRHGR
jgi:hypothetical protein